MKDYLKYKKFNINCWSAHSQIQNLVLSDETMFYKYWTEQSLQWKKTPNGRRPPMEEDLQWKKASTIKT